LRRPVDSAQQYASIAFAETLTLEAIAASIGSVGDAYDNALAESTIGLFETEVIGKSSPFRAHPAKTVDDVVRRPPPVHPVPIAAGGCAYPGRGRRLR